MPRRQLLFLVLVNALISLLIALAVTWAVEQRRPDPEELAALNPPVEPVVVMATATPGIGQVATPVVVATPTPIPPGAAPAAPAAEGSTAGEQTVYVVEPGDSLLAIADRFNVTLESLMAANRLENPDVVFSGQRLVIPAPGTGSGATAAPGSSPAAGVGIVRVQGVGTLAEEMVEVVNEGDGPVNLQGWSLSGDNTPVYSFADFPLFPGGSVRVHSTGGADTSIDLYWGQPQAVWSAGSTVRLRNPQGTVVASVQVP